MYIGMIRITVTSAAPGAVDASNLTSEVTDSLLGTANVTESHLDSSVTDKLPPTPSVGDGDNLLVVNAGETGYEVGGIGTGANDYVRLDGSGNLPPVDGSNLTGVSSGEDGVYTGTWVTPPTISGPVADVRGDGTPYGYTASGSSLVHPDASSFTYHWEISQGNLSASTGTTVNATFSAPQSNSVVTLSVYAEDDIGNKSGIVNLSIPVDLIVAPSGLVLSLPSSFNHNEAEQLDITVGDNGGDPSLSYSWERSVGGGSWITTGFSSPTIKSPTLTLTSGTSVQIRCSVSNSAGAATSTSRGLLVTSVAPDGDSDFLDTSSHILTSPSDSYTVPQISQQGGQGDFQEISVEVQWTRNKWSATESGGNAVINHGSNNLQPFNAGDAILMSGDADVVAVAASVEHSGTNPYFTTIVASQPLPTNLSSVEVLPIHIECDLSTGTPSYQALVETYGAVDGTTAKATATLVGASGPKADIRVSSVNSDSTNVTVTRIEATFRV